MQMASSARSRYALPRSASLNTATVSMPNSRHARMIRRAISPRLAIRMRLNIGLLARIDLEEGRVERHGVLVRDEHGHNLAAHLGRNRVIRLHRLDQADRRIRIDVVSHAHVRLG